MSITIDDVARLVCGVVHGAADIELRGVSAIEHAAPGDLVFCDQPRRRGALASCRASAVLIDDVPSQFPGTAVLVERPRAAFVAVYTKLFARDPFRALVHPQAIVAATATLGDVQVDAGAAIEDEVVVGARTAVHAGAVIRRGARVGAACRIGANAVIEPRAVIGDHVSIGAGTVIGNEGFGFVAIGDEHTRFPQIGGVILEDRVEVGANCTINRGALSDTVLRRGAKLDDLVHVAHNVEIGANALIAAHVAIAGSARIGEGVKIGGYTAIAEGRRIERDAVIGGWSAVTRNIAAGAACQGVPARPLRHSLRCMAAFGQLPQLLKRLRHLEARVVDIESKR